MGSPITWQNVNQGDASTAWRAMDSAQRSVNGAFDGLTGIIKESEGVQAKNDVAIKGNNTQDYLNKLTSAFKSPEDLAAGLADGRVDALKASYGNSINHEQARGAAESLLNTKYAQVKAATEYGHAMADERSHPFMQAYKVASLKGDTAGMAAADAAYTAAGGRDLAGIVSFADQRKQEMELRGRATTEFGWKGQNQADNLLTTANQRATSLMQANASQSSAAAAVDNAATNKASLIGTLQDKAEGRQIQAATGMGTISNHLVGSPDGAKAVNTVIAALPDDAAKRTAARIVASMPKDATAADVATAITSINQRWWRSNDHIEEEVMKVFQPMYEASKKDKGTKDIVEARKALYSGAAARAVQDSNNMRDLLVNALPGARRSK